MSHQGSSNNDVTASSEERNGGTDVERVQGDVERNGGEGIRAGTAHSVENIEPMGGVRGFLLRTAVRKRDLQPDFNPYLGSYVNYETSVGNQVWAIMLLCVVFILADTLLLGYAESQAALLVPMVSIMFLVAALAGGSTLQMHVINGVETHTLKEAEKVVNRPWNMLTYFLACALCIVGIFLFVADLCILAFDALDDEYHAVWITVFIGLCCILSCCYGLVLIVSNGGTGREQPNPDPLAV